MEIILKILIAIIPSVVALIYIKSFIKHTCPKREIWLTFSFSILISTLLFTILFIAGLLSAKYEINVTLFSSNTSDPLIYGILCSLFTTAVPEEGFKLIIILLFCSRRKYFKKPIDGMVYGAAVSIGFATTENILVVVFEGTLAILGGVKILLLHAMLGGIMGYHLSRSRLCKGYCYKKVLLAFVIPCGLHALHNFSGFFIDSILANDYNLPILFYFLLLVIPLASLVISFCIAKKYLSVIKGEDD